MRGRLKNGRELKQEGDGMNEALSTRESRVCGAHSFASKKYRVAQAS